MNRLLQQTINLSRIIFKYIEQKLKKIKNKKNP